jgi:hypothetical protein
MGGFNFYTYGPGEPSPKPPKPQLLVKLADVIKPVAPTPVSPALTALAATADSPSDTVIWSYKKPAETKEERKAEDAEKDTTPGFDFSEKVNDHEGQERKVELSPSGLYVFDKKEKFEYKTPPPVQSAQSAQAAQAAQARGGWIGVKRQFADGNLIVPMKKAGEFKTVKIRGLKAVLNLTKKTK